MPNYWDNNVDRSGLKDLKWSKWIINCAARGHDDMATWHDASNGSSPEASLYLVPFREIFVIGDYMSNFMWERLLTMYLNGIKTELSYLEVRCLDLLIHVI